MSYLQYENGVFWARSNLLLVANAALFGFAASNLPMMISAGWDRTISHAVISVAGIFLTVIWRGVLKRGEFWVLHWHDLLVKLEPKAFGREPVIRTMASLPAVREPSAGRVKELAYHLQAVFLTLWILSCTRSRSAGRR
jgi:hypothetical protein